MSSYYQAGMYVFERYKGQFAELGLREIFFVRIMRLNHSSTRTKAVLHADGVSYWNYVR
jgi:hypothetical protein